MPRRFLRIAFNTLTVFSLVLAALIICARVFTHHTVGSLGYVKGTTCIGISWRNSAFALIYEERRPTVPLSPGRHLYGSRGGWTYWPEATQWRHAGWERRSSPVQDLTVLTMTMPLAEAIALTLPVAWGSFDGARFRRSVIAW